mmetsp:Transcript_27516/g.64162  ORF Transcript_27516/g.64162 Transcript_27516/m.64162 type:complete len:253 (-) Transcript_27516:68-826(-)|eukprot:CAMPEP_0178420128 /NCGR_PEP_ID=MMETSP0689_2-20121128/25970_1 /TAXON_ID=160604 /ORGANISM="Amphidinium massartii, Strain CS-259" /LENGTH=252 /DNA_ID=CAMNT_0020041595 /DNA_START=44 /DNA_END=802 /DNA_ORIENTATION=+
MAEAEREVSAKENSAAADSEAVPVTAATESVTSPEDPTLAPKVSTMDGQPEYIPYKDERQMPGIIQLIEKDLSEPYSIFTYRYFINNWPDLCFLAMLDGQCIGAVVCKLDVHRCRQTHRGYIAMLAVEKEQRGKSIGSRLVHLSLDRMAELGADECVLETEVTNTAALGLYRSIGFVKEKRLHKYYLNGNDAFRLKYLFRLPQGFEEGLGCLGPLGPAVYNGDSLEGDEEGMPSLEAEPIDASAAEKDDSGS